jgi:S1-C subfamily serine protease
VASGTLITKDGLILTNGHMFEKGWNYVDYDLLLISITDNPDLPAEDRYYADLLEADIDRDVALLRIKTDLKYRPVDPTLLNLTYLQIGDASTLKLGDPLIILGYPVIGGNTITLTRGEVAGFQPSRKLGARAWIKTSGNITGGASGGAVLDQFGKLVGIPTQLGGGTASGPLVDCRLIADTNGDGDVDYKDACIPTGGFLNAIRSINLALPMIQKAMGTVTAGQ